MLHAIITRDADILSWVKIWEFSETHTDVFDDVIITIIIVYEMIYYVYWD